MSVQRIKGRGCYRVSTWEVLSARSAAPAADMPGRESAGPANRAARARSTTVPAGRERPTSTGTTLKPARRTTARRLTSGTPLTPSRSGKPSAATGLLIQAGAAGNRRLGSGTSRARTASRRSVWRNWPWSRTDSATSAATRSTSPREGQPRSRLSMSITTTRAAQGAGRAGSASEGSPTASAIRLWACSVTTRSVCAVSPTTWRRPTGVSGTRPIRANQAGSHAPAGNG